MINCFACDNICFNKEHYSYICGICKYDTPYCSICRRVLEVVLDDKYFRCRICKQLAHTESLIFKVPNTNNNFISNQNLNNTINQVSYNNFNNIENLGQSFVNLDFRTNNINNDNPNNQFSNSNFNNINQINNNHVFYDNNSMIYSSRPFQMRIHEKINDNTLNESLNKNKDNRVKYNQDIDFFNNKNNNDCDVLKSSFNNISYNQGVPNFSFNGVSNEYSHNMKYYNPNSNNYYNNVLNNNNSKNNNNSLNNKESLQSVLSLNSNSSNSFSNTNLNNNFYTNNSNLNNINSLNNVGIGSNVNVNKSNLNIHNSLNNTNLNNSYGLNNNNIFDNSKIHSINNRDVREIIDNRVEYDYSSVKRINSNFSLDIENKLKTPDKLSISPEKYKISNKLSSGKHDAHNNINAFILDENLSNIASKKTVQTSFEDLYEAINANSNNANNSAKYSNFINNRNYINIDDQIEPNIVKNDGNYSLLSTRNNMKLSFGNIISKNSNNINGNNISSKHIYKIINRF